MTATVAVRNGVHTAMTTDDAALRVELVDVTPDMAANWLKRGGKNRKVVQRRVDALSAAIHRGEWQLTGEAIKLDANGQVRDGQHRLHAIVKSGLTVKSLVVRGVDEPAFDVMDSGRPRSAGDVLGIHGHSYGHALSGAARLLIFMERYGEFDPTNREHDYIITPVVTLKYIESHPDVEQGLRLGDRVRKAGLQGGVSVWAALFTLFLRSDAEKAYAFAHHLVTGESLGKNHPALVLRARLIFRQQGDRFRSLPGREQLAAMVIKAWNAFYEGREIQTLFFRTEGTKAESFPKPR